MNVQLESFKAVVLNGVLVAIDLLLINEKMEVLLGKRLIAPAKGYFCVPGGSVRKGETLAGCLKRVAQQETGLEISPSQASLRGIYDHMYEDSYFDSTVPTQYVVMACSYRIGSEVSLTPDDQHEYLRFMSIPDLLNSPEVHPYTKSYFQAEPANLFVRAGGSINQHSLNAF